MKQPAEDFLLRVFHGGRRRSGHCAVSGLKGSLGRAAAARPRPRPPLFSSEKAGQRERTVPALEAEKQTLS